MNKLKAYVGAVGATKLTAILVVACILGVFAVSMANVFAVPTGYIYTTNAEGIDQTDFAPGDYVYIHGTGFDPDAPVTISLTRPDVSVEHCGPDYCDISSDFGGSYPTGFNGLQTSDANGEFVYIYDLDGVEGTYIVDVSDGTNVAQTTFTDAVCSGVSCSNDAPCYDRCDGSYWYSGFNKCSVSSCPGYCIYNNRYCADADSGDSYPNVGGIRTCTAACDQDSDCTDTSRCNGKIYQTRTGDCTSSCQCSYDSWTDGTCSQSVTNCGATCDEDSDCGTGEKCIGCECYDCSTTLLSDDFEGDLSKWNTDWELTTSQAVSPTHSVEGSDDDNDLISNDLNAVGASAILITFQYMVDDISDGDDVYAQYYDGSTYDNINEIGDDTEDTWLTYSGATTDSQYFISNFRLKIEGSSIDSNEHLWVDDVSIKKCTPVVVGCDSYQDSTSCETDQGCDWCPQCDPAYFPQIQKSKVNQWHTDKCVDAGTSCGYYCDQNYCNAECDAETDCPCPADGCVGNDYYDYPAYGECPGCPCMCHVSTEPDEPCAPTVTTDDPRCTACNFWTNQVACQNDQDCQWCPGCNDPFVNAFGISGNCIDKTSACQWNGCEKDCGAQCETNADCPDTCVGDERYYGGECDAGDCDCNYAQQNCDDGNYCNGDETCADGQCVPGTPPTTETICNDQIDNDCDGTTDCADLDCDGSPYCYQRACDAPTDICTWNKVLPLGSENCCGCNLGYNTYWPVHTITSATCTFNANTLQSQHLYISINNDIINCTLNGDLIFQNDQHENCAEIDPRNGGFDVELSPANGANTLTCYLSDDPEDPMPSNMDHFDACIVQKECFKNEDCGACQKCVDNACVAQSNSEDLKNECAAGDCANGFCNGQGACSFDPDTKVCRGSAGICDVAEYCSGVRADCPSDAKSTAMCRTSAGQCDVDEYCDGINNDCPFDAQAPFSTQCDDGFWCSASDHCDGNGNCVQLAARDCSDSLYCTVNERCDEALDQCVSDPMDCSGNNIDKVETCGNNPDDFASTFDWRPAFTSTCDEKNDECTTGDKTISHTCADAGTADSGPEVPSSYLRTCSAECDGYGTECLPYIGTDNYCYYKGGCNTDPSACACSWTKDGYCPVPGTIFEGNCYWGERSCNDEVGCTLHKDPMDCNNYCNATSGPQDTTGPITDILTLTPDPTCGKITFNATITENCTNIADGIYAIDSCPMPGFGGYQVLPLDDNSYDGDKMQELVGVVDLMLTGYNDGRHTLYIRGKNTDGAWGNCDAYGFEIDTLPPVTESQNITPLMACGSDPYLVARICDPFDQSGVCGAEYYIDDFTQGDGLGIPMFPVDGQWGDECEDVYAWVNISQVSEGTHYIKAHGVDCTGCNWGKIKHFNPVLFIKDTVAPTSVKTVGTPKIECDYDNEECWFITQTTKINMSAQDSNPGDGEYSGNPSIPEYPEYNGFVNIYYRQRWKENYDSVWGPWSSWTLYTGPFNFTEDSIHEIEYYSTDACGNNETSKYEIDIVDTKYPDGFKTVGEPNVTCALEQGCDYWVRDHFTPITLDCIDPQPHPVDHEKMCYRISFDVPQTPYLTAQYCAEFQQGGYMEGDWCCVDKYAVTGAPQLPYTFTFMEDSLHDLEYYCEDVLGNRNPVDLEYFRVDSVPPEIVKGIEGPSYASSGTCPPQSPNDICFLDGVTNITVQMTDPDPTGRNCNVSGVYCEWGYYLDQDPTFYGWYDTFPIHFLGETKHELHIKCWDALGNPMQEDVETFYVDKTPPTITKTYGYPRYPDDMYHPTWITNQTQITLTVEDTGPHKSGIKETKYRVTLMPDNSYCEDQMACESAQVTGTWNDYTVPFTITEDSCHLIEYYSKDNVDKTDGVHKQCIYVDNKAPVSVKDLGTPKHTCTPEEQSMYYNGMPNPTDGCYFITQSTPITLTCADQNPHPVDHVQIKYKDWIVGQTEPEWTVVSDDHVTITKNEDSAHILKWYCVDVLGNAENLRTEYDIVETVPPVGEKIVGDPKIPCEGGDEITGPTKVLILHSNFNELVADVMNKLSAYPDLQVSIYSVASQTPTLGELMQYDSVLVYTNMMPYDPVGLGNVLADYADIGGGVTLATFDWLSPWFIQGRFMTQGYGSIPMGASGNVYSPGVLGASIAHPVMQGVDAFATRGYRSGYAGPLNPGATLVASYMDQQVLVAVNEAHGRTCDLGFFPPSDQVICPAPGAGYCSWDPATDGALLMHNCLTWTAYVSGDTCDYWVRDHVTPITLDCDDSWDGQTPHPVDHEAMCYRISFDDPATPYLTAQYCTLFGGMMEGDWCCADVSGDKKYIFNFTEDSLHDLEYYCVDELGNENQKDVEYFKVDSVPPVITKGIEGPSYGDCLPQNASDVCYIDGVSDITVQMTDPDPTGRNCNVSGVYCEWGYYLDQDPTFYGWYDTFPIHFLGETKHELHIKCWDALGNPMQEDVETFYVDKTPPVTTKSYGLPYHVEDSGEWINSSTTISLSVDDAGPHKSGIQETKYRVTQIDDIYCNKLLDTYCAAAGSGDWQTYTGQPFTINQDSCHKIEFYSVDNVNKTEDVKWQCVYVDSEPPVITKLEGEPKIPCDPSDPSGCVYWVRDHFTPIDLYCTDDMPHPVDHVNLWYRILMDGNEIVPWTDAIAPEVHKQIIFTEDSVHTIEYYCEDILGNSEGTRENPHRQVYRVDSTPPESNKTIGEPKWWDESLGLYWVTSDTQFTLTAVDQADPCAVGVAGFWVTIEWDSNCDGTVDTVLLNQSIPEPYQYTFTLGQFPHPGAITKECLHKISWYAIDRLGNTEQLHEQFHKVDNTPPHVLIIKPVDGWYSDGEDIPIVSIAEDLNSQFGPCEDDCYGLGTECAVGIEDGTQCEAYLLDILPQPKIVELETEGTFLYNAEAHECQGYATIPLESGIPDGTVILVVRAKDNLGNEAGSLAEILRSVFERCGCDVYDLCAPSCIDDVMQDIITIWNLPKIGIDNNAPVVNITAPEENSLFGGEQVFVSADVSDSYEGEVTSAITSGTPCYITLGGVSMGTVPYDNVARKCAGTIMIPEDNDFPQGMQALKVEIADNAGNLGYDTVSVNVDTTKPVLSIINPANNMFVKGVVTIDVAVSDANLPQIPPHFYVKVSTDNGQTWHSTSSCLDMITYWKCSYSWNTAAETDGMAYGIVAKLTDAADNTGYSEVVLVIVDNDAPEGVYIVDPVKDEIVEGTITLKALATDYISGVQGVKIYVQSPVAWDCDATLVGGTWQCAFNSATLVDGQHQVYAVATDNMGQTTTSAHVPFTIDNNAPSTPSCSYFEDPDSDGYDEDGVVTLRWCASSDDGAGMDYYEVEITSPGQLHFTVDAEEQDYTPFITISDLYDGEWHGYVRAWDKSGKASDWTEGTMITIDTIPPAAVDIWAEDTEKGSEPLYYDNDADFELVWSGGSDANFDAYYLYENDVNIYTGGDTGLSMSGMDDGTYRYYVVAKDKAGWDNVASFFDVVVDTQPPELEVNAPVGFMGMWTFTYTLSDPDPSSGIDRVEVSDADTDFVTCFPQGWCMVLGGSWVELTAYDKAGNSDTASTEGASADTTPPMIVYSSPSGVIDYNQVTLKVNISEAGECYYSDVDEWEQMGTMYTSDNIEHWAELGTPPGPLADGLYVYHVQCEDMYGNVMEHSKTIVFYVNTLGEYCYAVDMNAGWNTFFLPKLILDDINFNCGQEPYATEDVLTSLTGKYEIIWYYDENEGWLFYWPEHPEYSTLMQFNDEVSNPYYIKMTEPARLGLQCDQGCEMCSAERTYTVNADFDEGTLNGLEHDSVPDQLQLIMGETTTYPVMWIANAGEDTVSKFDTTNGKELARYPTWYRVQQGPVWNYHGGWDGAAPSRTAVDAYGNVYVANRQFSGITNVIKIMANEADCVDRNSNGVIDTSRDLNMNGEIDTSELMPVVDSNSNGILDIDDFQDECVKWVSNVGSYGAVGRSLAIDMQGNIWLGLFYANQYYKLSSVDGSILYGPISTGYHTPYGALVDKNGILWGASLSSNMLRLDTNTYDVQIINIPQGTYGIAIGYSQTGYTQVYLGGTSYTYTQYDSETGALSNPAERYYYTGGLAVDKDGNIVAGCDGDGTVTKFAPDGSEIWHAAAQDGSGYAHGTVIDSNNDVWLVYLYGDKVAKYSGVDGTPLGAFNTGVTPYTYSDATGLGLRSSLKVGKWDVVFNSEQQNTDFETVSWSSGVPEGTTIEVRVRSSNDMSTWSSWEAVTNGDPLTVPNGQYLEIEATMTSPQETSPILFDLTVNGVCGGEEIPV